MLKMFQCFLLISFLVTLETGNPNDFLVSFPRGIFSDLDGTLLHYAKHFRNYGVTVVQEDPVGRVGSLKSKDGEIRMCRVFKSSALGNGFVSYKTMDLVEELRNRGTKFAIVSGARTSTLMERLPHLPLVDAVASETGCRIYFPKIVETETSGDFNKVSVRWEEDESWTAELAPAAGTYTTGPESPPPEHRDGPLWDLYRRLAAKGLRVDARGYCASFRAIVRDEADAVVLDGERAACHEFLTGAQPSFPAPPRPPPGALACVCNLGHYDFMPAAAGKGAATRRLQAPEYPRA